MSGALYELAMSVPWCITDDALEAMLRIAADDPLPEDEAKRRFHGPKSLALRNGKRREDSGRMTMQGSVAIIPIDGPIYRYADFFTSVSGGVTTESLARDVGLALDDPTVRAILLPIDSPGGEATGINELADTIYQARGKKPIVAYIEGFGASAAYWIASAADLLLLDATAGVGSIGTVFGVADPTKRISRTIDFVSSQSPKKRADPTTEAGRAYYQTMVDDMTEVFIAKVMRNRGITRAQVLAAEGGMLIGEKAIAAGLADALGSEEGAIGALLEGALPARILPTTVAAGANTTPKETKRMAKGFWAWMAGEGDEKPASAPPALASDLIAVTAPLQAVQSKTDDDAAHAGEMAALRKELAQARAAQIQTEAQAFAKEQIAAGHTYPVAQASLIALYALAAEDDAAAPRADGHTRVAALRAFVEIQPANQLSKNLIQGAPLNGTVLANNAGAADPYADDAASARAYAEKANGNRASQREK